MTVLGSITDILVTEIKVRALYPHVTVKSCIEHITQADTCSCKDRQLGRLLFLIHLSLWADREAKYCVIFSGGIVCYALCVVDTLYIPDTVGLLLPVYMCVLWKTLDQCTVCVYLNCISLCNMTVTFVSRPLPLSSFLLVVLCSVSVFLLLLPSVSLSLYFFILLIIITGVAMPWPSTPLDYGEWISVAILCFQLANGWFQDAKCFGILDWQFCIAALCKRSSSSGASDILTFF